MTYKIRNSVLFTNICVLGILALLLVSASMPGSASAAELGKTTAGSPKWNVISIPLESSDQFTSGGYAYNADGLANMIGRSAVSQILQWNGVAQNWEKWDPNGGFGGTGSGTNFSLLTNGVYLLQLNNLLSGNSISFVGAVPAAGSVQYSLVGSNSSCKWNTITMPLDQSDITTASQFAVSLGETSVREMLRWNSSVQNWEKWEPNGGFGGNGAGTNFAVEIGTPFFLCLLQNATWPASN